MVVLVVNAKRHTKIIYSCEPEKLDYKTYEKMQDHFDALRITYAPSNIEKILSFTKKVAKARESKQLPPLMIDVSYRPRAVVVDLKAPMEVKSGDSIKLSCEKDLGEIQISSQEWDKLFQKDARVYFGYGDICASVSKVDNKVVVLDILQEGIVSNNMELHIPITYTPASIFDLSFIDIGPFLDLAIDYVIIPGIPSRRQIELVRKKLLTAKTPIWIITKVDSKQAYDSLDDILEVSDGVMISRNDLGLTMDPASVPILVKDIIKRCRQKARAVFVASEMLATMKYNFFPTRAEVSDIANAAGDQADAVVMSSDISLGPHVQRSLQLTNKILCDIEAYSKTEDIFSNVDTEIEDIFSSVAFHSYRVAKRVGAKAIVCLSEYGNTALRIASYRPQIPIIVVTFSKTTCRKMSIVFGSSAFFLEQETNLDNIFPELKALLKKETWLKSKDSFVLVSTNLSSLSHKASNLFTIQQID
jgi:pyruvate kinase